LTKARRHKKETVLNKAKVRSEQIKYWQSYVEAKKSPDVRIWPKHFKIRSKRVIIFAAILLFLASTAVTASQLKPVRNLIAEIPVKLAGLLHTFTNKSKDVLLSPTDEEILAEAWKDELILGQAAIAKSGFFAVNVASVFNQQADFNGQAVFYDQGIFNDVVRVRSANGNPAIEASELYASFAIVQLAENRTYTFPDASGVVSLLSQSIEGSEITDSTITEIDLSITNTPTDNYFLTYDAASGGFTWVANPDTVQSFTDTDTHLTEDEVEAFIFDSDAENISGVWEVQDNVAFNFGSDGDFSFLYDETTDDRLEITASNKELYIDIGNQDVVIAGLDEGTTALSLTAGDLLISDGDLTLSSGEVAITTDSTEALLSLTKSSDGLWLAFNDGTDVWGLYNYPGSPEGNITANTGTLAMDTSNGTLYVKTDDGDATGWTNLATGSGSLFTDSSGVTYLTDTDEDLAIGGTDTTAA